MQKNPLVVEYWWWTPGFTFFFLFFSHRGRWKKPPHNERLHSVAGAGGTAAPRLSENSMYRRGAFDIRLLFPNCVENYTVIRQKVNTCRFFHSWSGRKLFFLDTVQECLPSHVHTCLRPLPPGMVTNCRVGCQRAALHFEDDSQWHGAFDPLPGFVNKEYTLIDAAHIMAVWELAGEKKTRLSCWKSPKTPHHHRLCRRGPSCRKALLSCFQHLTLYNAYYGSSTPHSIYLSFLSRGSVARFQQAFDQHPRPFKEKKKKKKALTSRNADWVSYSYVLKWTRRCLSRAQCDAAKWNVDQPLINHNGW